MDSRPDTFRNLTHRAARWSMQLHALPIVAFVLLLFCFWFGYADRYRVFLYHHYMGELYPDTSPFSAVTSSRYWMAGLVASGFVMLFYAFATWLLGRFSPRYRPPDWWRVWALCALPLLIGIPAITMTVNQPTLPLVNTVQVTLATLAGLALALAPGEMAARRPGEFIWLTLDGCALALVTTSAIGLERMGRWTAGGATWRVVMMVAAISAGVVGLLIITGLRTWRRSPVPGAPTVFIAGLCAAYLLLPLVHHVMGTDGHFYITDSDNFFVRNGALQLAIWMMGAVIALGVTQLRKLLAARRAAAR